MNRKLLNGLLVVAFAAGGVVTFTSCKDEDYLNKVVIEEEEQLAEEVTAVAIDRTYNPVLGSINLPFNVNSNVLATYVVQGAKTFDFPTGGYPEIAPASPLPEDDAEEFFNIIEKLQPETVEVKNGNYTSLSNFGQMGSIYAVVNPTSVDLLLNKKNYKAELVKSDGTVVYTFAQAEDPQEGEEASSTPLDPGEIFYNTDVFTFGVTRSTAAKNNGVYKFNVAANSNFQYFETDDLIDYLSDVKEAIKDKSASNIAKLGEVLYKSLNNKVEALALKVSWNEDLSAETPVWNSALSSFQIAPAIIHPVSYGLPISDVLGDLTNKRLPMFSPLEDYLTKIQNKLTIDYKDIQGVDANIEFKVFIEGGYVWFVYENSDGTQTTSKFEYTASGITASDADLQSFVQAIVDANNAAYSGTLVKELNDAIMNINEQMKSYISKIDDINNYIDKIKDDKKVDYVDKLIELYNKIAGKINNVIANPDHYLQVAAIYSDDNGYYHHLSTDPKCPTTVDTGIDIIASSYTGDLVVPSYLKYVAITQVNGDDATQANNTAAGAFANTVYPGHQFRFPLNLSSFSGKTLTITYMSVDYHGAISMQNYYVKVQ